jgi:hypothetical protein
MICSSRFWPIDQLVEWRDRALLGLPFHGDLDRTYRCPSILEDVRKITPTLALLVFAQSSDSIDEIESSLTKQLALVGS